MGSAKYDATVASMIALLKYGSGLPFNRLEGLQGSLGIPLPASTQWDIVSDAAKTVEPIYEELIRQAAQGEVLHNDDTTMKILELMGKRAKAKALAEGAGEGEGEGEGEDAPERPTRKNALFYLSENGARVGDLLMSLIYTCQLCSANPFNYLTELLRHVAELPSRPGQWMPWNYRETLEPAGTTADAARA